MDRGEWLCRGIPSPSHPDPVLCLTFTNKTRMKKTVIFLFLVMGVLLSACAGGGATVATSWPGLAVDENSAYLANGQHIYAVDLAKGGERWRFPGEASTKISFFASPALTSDGQLLAGGFDHVLYSLNPENGSQNWAFNQAKDRYIGTPLATDRGIYAPNADGTLYAVDADGKIGWTFKTDRAQWAKPIADTDCGCIYIPSMDHHVYSVNAQTGNLNWKSENLGGSVVGTPAFDPEGRLYTGTFNSEMLAMDAQTGKVLWRFPTKGWVWGGPALQNGRLYFGDLSGAFYAVDAASGQPAWQTQVDGRVAESPLVTTDAIYLGTDLGSLYALDLDGKEKWKQAIGGKLYTTPVLAGDTLLAAPTGADALLYAFDLTGKQKWTPFVPEKK